MVESLITTSPSNFNLYNGATGIGASITDILKRLFTALDSKESAIFTGQVRQGDPIGYVADISNTRQNLSWEPKIKWQEGVLEYVEWFKSHEIN